MLKLGMYADIKKLWGRELKDEKLKETVLKVGC